MAELKALQQALLAAVGERMSKYGFDKRPRGYSFYRSHDWGKASFHLSIIGHADDFYVTADVAIRFHALEELVERENKYRKSTFSMGVELGNLAQGEPKRWTIRVPADVQDVADQIVAYFEKFGRPYIETYSDMPTALAALSGDDRDAWLHEPFHGAGAKRAVGLAWILGDERKVRELIELKTRYLTERKDLDLVSFKAFAESLQPRR